MPNGTWQQQFMPNLHGAIIKDITFTDSLTGYAVTNVDSFSTAYILKTTNSGNTWFNSLTENRAFTKVIFLNSNTGFVGRVTVSTQRAIYKTTNGGTNWDSLYTPFDIAPIGMSLLNEDTIWIADDVISIGGIYRTTNGGINWVQQYGAGGGNPSKIYMYNGRTGFMCNTSNLYKTTNSGVNWSAVPGGGFIDIHFIDSLTGWKSGNGMKKTTDGGLSWLTQTLPSGANIITSAMSGFTVINKDTIYGAGGIVSFGGDKFSGIIYRTTNGGNNWLYQIIDTSFSITGFYDINFINKNVGWAFGTKRLPNTQLITYSNIHTINGGDTTFIVGLQQISSQVPKEYKLFQNFPNPFNPTTNIGFRIAGSGLVTLKIFDINGKEISELFNKELKPGEYNLDWNASGFSSGVYFYKLTVISGKEVFTETKKAVMIK